MTSNNKRIAKNTLMLYFRMLLTMLVTLYTSRVVLRLLGVSDFGIFNVVGGVATMFSFLNSAMTSGTQRFLAFELGKKNLEEFQKVFSITLSIHILTAILIGVLAESIGLYFVRNYLTIPSSRVVAAVWVYHLSILSFLISVIQVPYNSAIIAHENMNFYAYISVFEVFLKLGVVLLLEKVWVDKLITYAVLIFVVNLSIAIAYQRFCKKEYRECKFKAVWDRELFMRLLSYGGWNLFGNMAFVAHMQGVNILLNLFFGPAINAARGIAFQVKTATFTFVNNFQLAVKPQIVKSFATKERQYMMNLIYRSSKYSFFLLWLISLPLLLESEFVLGIWLGVVPDYTKIFCQLLILNSLIDSFSGPLMTAAQATGQIKKYQVLVGSFLLLNLPLSYFFLYWGFEPQVTIFISISLSCVALMLRLKILHELIDFQIFHFLKSVVLLSILVAFLSCLLPWGINLFFPKGLARFILVSILGFLGSGLMIFLVGFDEEECKFVKSWLFKKLGIFND